MQQELNINPEDIKGLITAQKQFLESMALLVDHLSKNYTAMRIANDQLNGSIQLALRMEDKIDQILQTATKANEEVIP